MDSKIIKSAEMDRRHRVTNSRVLIVDDMMVMRQLVEACLENEGFSHFEFASDGRECLEKISEFKPDIIILDINMPEINGLEVCRQLRAKAKYSDLPILVQSALDAPHERTAVFEAGATDFITKPLNPPELVSRVRKHLENQILIHDLKVYQKRVADELEVAHQMQSLLLPNEKYCQEIASAYGVEVESFYKASSELGGDIWGLWPIDKKKFGVYAADFSGHGVGSALNTFRLHTLMESQNFNKANPSDFLAEINARLHQFLPVGQFSTMMYAVIDIESQEIEYASSAAPNPLVIMNFEDKVSVTQCESSGLPLGVTASSSYKSMRIPFTAGTRFLLYSDALIESEVSPQEQLGTDRLVKMVKSIATQKSGGLVTPLVAKFNRAVNNEIDDDLTLICIGNIDTSS